MSDPVFKANPDVQPLHLQAAAVDAQRLNPLRVDVPSTPVLHVDPVLQHGGVGAGVGPDAWTAMQQAVTALQQANAALAARVAELEKSNVAVRLILQGVDPALTAVNKKVDDLRAEYTAHGHELPFSYQPYSMLKDGGDRDFLIAYIWEGQHQNWTPFQQQQDAQKRGAMTGKAQPKP